MLDKVIVKGIPGLDGEYECDIVGMLIQDHPETMSNREGHRVKVMSGVRAGEYDDALQAGDNDFFLALAAIVLTRRGKRFDEAVIWDAPMGSGVTLEIADREADGDPLQAPPAGASSSISEPPSSPGGNGGEATSDSPPSDPSPTGAAPSATTSTSDPATSAT